MSRLRYSMAAQRGERPQKSSASTSAPYSMSTRDDEQTRRLDSAIAGSVEQRRHAAFGFGASAAIGQAATVDADALGSAARSLARRDEPGHRPLSRLHVDGRAPLKQEPDGRGMILADGEHQRGLLKLRVARFHARPGIQEHLHRF